MRLKNLLRATRFLFPGLREKIAAPISQGVYLIYTPDNRLLHVGRTYRAKRGLAQRLHDHMVGASSFSSNYLPKHGRELRNGYKFCYVEIDSGRVRALLEAYATGYLCPAYIGTSE